MGKGVNETIYYRLPLGYIVARFIAHFVFLVIGICGLIRLLQCGIPNSVDVGFIILGWGSTLVLTLNEPDWQIVREALSTQEGLELHLLLGKRVSIRWSEIVTAWVKWAFAFSEEDAMKQLVIMDAEGRRFRFMFATGYHTNHAMQLIRIAKMIDEKIHTRCHVAIEEWLGPTLTVSWLCGILLVLILLLFFLPWVVATLIWESIISRWGVKGGYITGVLLMGWSLVWLLVFGKFGSKFINKPPRQ